MTDQQRFKALLAHPDYWENEEIQRETEALGRKIWQATGKSHRRRIQISINDRIVITGTAEELAQRTYYSEKTIRNMARLRSTDRYGKRYQYID